MQKIISLFKLVRPQHYLKNVFIFAPIFFALKINDLELLFKCFVASIAFSLIAGVVYIINDYKDIEEDKLHPKKKFRPLASGKVTKPEAVLLGITIFILGIILSYAVDPMVTLLCLGYFIMNLLYSLWLKRVAIVDIFIIAIGFVIRLYVGAVAAQVLLTHWIVILTFLFAIFISLAKRLDDVVIYNTTGAKMRKSIDGYNEQFLNVASSVSLSVMLVAYIIYTTLPEVTIKFRSNNLYLTSLFVIFGVFRYLQITYVKNKSGSPVEILMKDRLIQLTIIGWIVTFGLLIYL